MILRRPMFRRGGSAEGGITSGLSRPGYKEGSGAFQSIDFTKGFEEAKKTRDEILGPYPKSSSLNDFLINFGLNMASASPTGNVIQTAAAQAKEPFAQFQQQKALDRAGRREEDKDFLNTWMTSRATVLGGESGADFSHESKIDIGLEALQNRQKHNQSWKPEWENLDPEAEDYEEQKAARQEWLDGREKIQHILNQVSTQVGVDVEKIVAAEGGYDNIKRSNKVKLLESEEMMTHPETGEQVEVGEYYSDNPELVEIVIDKMTIDDIKALILGAQGWDYTGNKEGGRVGYQGGELVEQEDVNIQTPQGDVSMQETVEEDVQPDQLSYEELRSRLPVEITDDIVRLLVNSAAALGDFAQIQTQQDVDNFNAKYGVNLVLPSEA